MKKSTAILFILLVISIKCIAQNNRIDSLKQFIETDANDTSRFDALAELTFYYTWANPDSALIYAHMELLLANKLKSDNMKAIALSSNSIVSSVIGNYSQALDFAFKSLQMNEKSGNKNRMFNNYIYLCMIYRDQGDFEHAIQYAYKAVNKSTLPNSPTKQKILAYGHIASVYEKFNQLDSALIYVKKAYEIENKNNKKWSLLPNTTGNIYEKKGDLILALQYYRQGISVAKSQNVVRDLVDMYNGMANIYIKTGQNDSSIYYAKKIIDINVKATYPLPAIEAANLLSNLYKLQNKSDSTIKYLEFSAVLKDSLFSREKQRQFQNISFSEQLRAQEIEAARKEYQSQFRINSLMGISFTLIVITLAFFINNKQKQKANAQLKKQKEEIQNTLIKLKSTQSQLIQSEKMASLGELTAGIAHEIQNPLNFVNNFSEVNSELIDELDEEAIKGNLIEVRAIAKDIKDNEQKILHHGKRADAIVKGMLQHSRTSTGQKEPTDINALADEYLRLAYHGLRAKDKSFNADFKTEFDESLPKINVIPQDIGRVLLNLINNAFYAVGIGKIATDEKTTSVETRHVLSLPQTPQNQPDYNPTVIVSTKNMASHVEIRVRDNGPGINKNIVDKIFQPFFTTKPTGQGTGLGLSMSYEIISKGHGGELLVETLEGEGSVFVIHLPI